MSFWGNLRQVWRHKRFRKLVGVRVASQAADGTLQVGMASYVLLSPQNQPDAWGIAAVLAITLLPFSVVGPFVSLVLDRWSRQRVVVVVDSIRLLLTIGIAALIATGSRAPGIETMLFLGLLLAMSLNRFVLAGLTAGLHYTVDEDEFLTASSVVPVIGPLGVMIGAALGAVARLLLGQYVPAHIADTAVFGAAAVLFACSVLLATRIGHWDLGPTVPDSSAKLSDSWTELVAAFGHLKERPVARTALLALGVQRTLFGFVMVASILGFRNYFHSRSDVEGAVADLGMWAGITGAGFLAASVFLPQLTRFLGLRRSAIFLMAASAVVQLLPDAIFTKPTLLIGSFLLGLFAQSFKICVDTLMQAHIDPDFKGRVFVIYDMIFNGAYVVAAVIAALVLPVYGLWLPGFVGVALGYACLAWWLAVRSRSVGAQSFEKGTQDAAATR